MEAAHDAALEQRPEAFESLYTQGRTRSRLALVSRASARGVPVSAERASWQIWKILGSKARSDQLIGTLNKACRALALAARLMLIRLFGVVDVVIPFDDDFALLTVHS
jgi:hypothetical protein